jgi:cytochrome b
LAAALTSAAAIGFLVDKEQPLFQFHMLFGIMAAFLVVVRVVMGLVGSRYSRFASFPLHPKEVVGYLVSAAFAKTKPYAGNNPGSALAAVLMFLLAAALLISGIGFGGEAGEDLHEGFAWALLSVIGLHLLGLAWHTIRHRENISLAMITGRKAGRAEEAIASGHAVWAAIILVGAGAWIAALFAGHDARAATVKIPGIGVTISLGENESEDGKPGRDRDDD